MKRSYFFCASLLSISITSHACLKEIYTPPISTISRSPSQGSQEFQQQMGQIKQQGFDPEYIINLKLNSPQFSSYFNQLSSEATNGKKLPVLKRAMALSSAFLLNKFIDDIHKEKTEQIQATIIEKIIEQSGGDEEIARQKLDGLADRYFLMRKAAQEDLSASLAIVNDADMTRKAQVTNQERTTTLEQRKLDATKKEIKIKQEIQELNNRLEVLKTGEVNTTIERKRAIAEYEFAKKGEQILELELKDRISRLEQKMNEKELSIKLQETAIEKLGQEANELANQQIAAFSDENYTKLLALKDEIIAAQQVLAIAKSKYTSYVTMLEKLRAPIITPTDDTPESTATATQTVPAQPQPLPLPTTPQTNVTQPSPSLAWWIMTGFGLFGPKK